MSKRQRIGKRWGMIHGPYESGDAAANVTALALTFWKAADFADNAERDDRAYTLRKYAGRLSDLSDQLNCLQFGRNLRRAPSR